MRAEALAMTETEPVPEYSWYVVMVQAETARYVDEETEDVAIGREFIAEHHLRLAGFLTFLPFLKVRKRYKIPSRDEWKVLWVRRAYFPRYLFVRVPASRGLYEVNNAFGVATVVHHGSEPLRVPEAVIDELKRRADNRGEIDKVDTTKRPRFKEGEVVIFNDNSPFQGLVATVSVDTGSNVRIWIAELLGKKREVSANPEHLRSVE